MSRHLAPTRDDLTDAFGGLISNAVIPRKQDERRTRRFDRDAYRERNRVERLINRLKQFRRIATRYEKRAANYLAMLHIGAILSWQHALADTS